MSEQSLPASLNIALAGQEKFAPRLRWARWFELLQPYLYLLPVIITLGTWIYWPLLRTVYWSFFQWNLLPTTPMVYVGWENYRRILTLPEMQQAIVNTLIYIIGIMPLSVLLPLVVAIFTDNLSKR